MKKRNMLTKVAALSMAGLMTLTGLPVAGLDGALSTEAAATATQLIQIDGKNAGNTNSIRLGQAKKLTLSSGANAVTGAFSASDTILAQDAVAANAANAANNATVDAKSSAYLIGSKTGQYVVTGDFAGAGDKRSINVNVEAASLKTDIVDTAVFKITDGTNDYDTIEVPASKMKDNSFTKSVKFVKTNTYVQLVSLKIGDLKLDETASAKVYIDGLQATNESGSGAGKKQTGAIGTYTVYLAGANANRLADPVSFKLTVGKTSLTSSNTKVKTLEPLEWSLKNEFNAGQLTDLLKIDSDGDGTTDVTLNGSDCDLTYSNNTGVTDTAQLRIEPKSTTGFSGSFTQKFTITKADISTKAIKVVGTNTTWLNNQAYTGSNIEPKGFELYYESEEVPYDDSRYATAYEKDNESNVAKNSDGVTDETGDHKVRYLKLSSTDWKVVSYDSNKNKGNATIHIVGGDSSNAKFMNTGAGMDLNFKIVGDDNDISKSAKVSMELEKDGEKVALNNGGSTVYTGTARTPYVTVTFTDKDKKETELINSNTSNTNITLTFIDNTDVGTATVKIQGAGDYCGSITQTFNITPKNINTDDVTIDSIGSVTYNGTAKTPKVEGAKDSESGNSLKQGKDYTVYYDNNINASEKAAVTLQGNGNYTGKKVFLFTIDPANFSSVKIDDVENAVYTGSEITPDIKATFTLGDGSTYTLVKDVDYSLAYSENVGNADSTTYSTGTISITGKNNFSGNDTKSFYIVPAANDLSQAEIELVDPSVEYDGSYHSAVVKSVKIGENVLSTNEYEIVEPVSEKEVGDYELQIRGTTSGEHVYGGIGTATFSVTAKAATVDFKLSATKKTYNGKAQSVTVKNVTRDGVEITEDEYTVSGTTKATAAGKKTVTVTLKGNYAGSAKKTWTINKAAQPLKVSPASKSFKVKAVKKAKKTFTIKATKAQGKVTYKSSSKKVTVSSKGKVTVKKGTKKGTYKITVKAAGNGNYKAGSKVVTIKVK